MGNRHTPDERKGWAQLSRSLTIDEVAARAGVKRETVMSWRSEFSIGDGGHPAVPPLARDPIKQDQRAPHTSSPPKEAPVVSAEPSLDHEVSQAIYSYLQQHRSWFNDEDARQADSIEMCQVIADWEAQHGPLTRQEKAQARAVLGR